MFVSTLVLGLLGLLMAGLAVGAFVWAARRGQFRDLERQALLPLDGAEVRLVRPWETAEEARLRWAGWGEELVGEGGEDGSGG